MTTPSQSNESIWAAIMEIAQSETLMQGGAKLRAMAGSLVEGNKLAQIVANISLPQRNQFVDLVVPIFESKRRNYEYDLEYLAALKVLNESPNQPRSEELIGDLDRVPPYLFENQIPNAWDAGNAVHLHKDYPGQIALALVSRGDAETQRLYHEKLSQTSGSLRAVMIWALGHSSRKDTFQYLLSLCTAATGDEKNVIIRSLNRLPLSIEEAAALSTEPNQKESLLAVSASLRQQLIEKKLSVELTVWD